MRWVNAVPPGSGGYCHLAVVAAEAFDAARLEYYLEAVLGYERVADAPPWAASAAALDTRHAWLRGCGWAGFRWPDGVPAVEVYGPTAGGLYRVYAFSDATRQDVEDSQEKLYG